SPWTVVCSSRGYPDGYHPSGETGADKGTRQIGVDTPKPSPTHLIVDGQQRLTSLFAVMTGAKVLRDDYSETRIRIAFRPSDGTFEVADAAIDRDPEFIPDISSLWQQGGKRATTREYLDRLRARWGVAEADAGRWVHASVR